jgi:hypothetical protein
VNGAQQHDFRDAYERFGDGHTGFTADGHRAVAKLHVFSPKKGCKNGPPPFDGDPVSSAMLS